MRKAALLVEDRDTQLVVRTALECAGLQCESYPTTVALLRALKRGEHRIVVVDFDRAQGDWASLRDWRDNWLNPDMSLIAIGSDGPWAASRAFEAGVDESGVLTAREKQQAHQTVDHQVQITEVTDGAVRTKTAAQGAGGAAVDEVVRINALARGQSLTIAAIGMAVLALAGFLLALRLPRTTAKGAAAARDARPAR